MADFPVDWPALLPTTLQTIQGGVPGQLYGALIVLADLVENTLSDEKFFSVARDIVTTIYNIASDQQQKLTLRALAIKIFRECFEIMDTIKDESEAQAKAFAEQTLAAWEPLFTSIIKLPLPPRTPEDVAREPASWREIMSIKIQTIKTLFRIRSVFPSVLLNIILEVFSAVWADLTSQREHFQDLYIDNDEQGRLEDADGLPYTLDFLVLEELDFLQSCLTAPPVKQELTTQIQASPNVFTTPFLLHMMQLTVALSQITNEDEGLWDIDPSLFLAEEAAVTGNYTARTACGDFVVKIGEWLKLDALRALLQATSLSYNEPLSTWKTEEASMFLLTTIMNDFYDTDMELDDLCGAMVSSLIDRTIGPQNHPLLRARSYLIAGVLVRGQPLRPEAMGLLDQTIHAITHDESDLVKVACIKALQYYVEQTTIAISKEQQIAICQSISDFLETRDMSELEDQEDLMMALVETLRFAINIDPHISLNSRVLDLLFLLAKHGGASFHLAQMVNEAFEEIVEVLSKSGAELYGRLCEKVLPSLIGAFDVGTLTEDMNLTIVSISASLFQLCTNSS